LGTVTVRFLQFKCVLTLRLKFFVVVWRTNGVK